MTDRIPADLHRVPVEQLPPSQFVLIVSPQDRAVRFDPAEHPRPTAQAIFDFICARESMGDCC
jgi:hypothetical protein